LLILNHFKKILNTFVQTQKKTNYDVLPRKAMTWAMRLKRVFNIDITICRFCQGHLKVIACIEERQVIDKDTL